MKEAEGGAIALDQRHLPTVVLELHQRGLQMKEAGRGAVDHDPIWDSVVKELETDGRDSTADFTRR
jgi:hypothetical protein